MQKYNKENYLVETIRNVTVFSEFGDPRQQSWIHVNADRIYSMVRRTKKECTSQQLYKMFWEERTDSATELSPYCGLIKSKKGVCGTTHAVTLHSPIYATIEDPVHMYTNPIGYGIMERLFCNRIWPELVWDTNMFPNLKCMQTCNWDNVNVEEKENDIIWMTNRNTIGDNIVYIATDILPEDQLIRLDTRGWKYNYEILEVKPNEITINLELER